MALFTVRLAIIRRYVWSVYWTFVSITQINLSFETHEWVILTSANSAWKSNVIPVLQQNRKADGSMKLSLHIFLTLTQDEGELLVYSPATVHRFQLKGRVDETTASLNILEQNPLPLQERNQTPIPWPCRWILWKTVTLWLCTMITTL